MIIELELRPIEPTDTARVHSWASDPRASRYQAWGPNTEDQTRDFVADAVAAWQAEPHVRFHFVANAGDLVVGSGELKIISRRFDRGEISYIVHPELWGRGYATKIATELIRYGFDELRLHRIDGTCDPRNLASAAVLRKIGMQYEGRMRHVMKISDGWRDSELFAILDSDSGH